MNNKDRYFQKTESLNFFEILKKIPRTLNVIQVIRFMSILGHRDEVNKNLKSLTEKTFDCILMILYSSRSRESKTLVFRCV